MCGADKKRERKMPDRYRDTSYRKAVLFDDGEFSYSKADVGKARSEGSEGKENTEEASTADISEVTADTTANDGAEPKSDDGTKPVTEEGAAAGGGEEPQRCQSPPHPVELARGGSGVWAVLSMMHNVLSST